MATVGRSRRREFHRKVLPQDADDALVNLAGAHQLAHLDRQRGVKSYTRQESSPGQAARRDKTAHLNRQRGVKSYTRQDSSPEQAARRDKTAHLDRQRGVKGYTRQDSSPGQAARREELHQTRQLT